MRHAQDQRRIKLLLFYGAVILVFYLAFRVMEPFLQPLGWAAVMVICLSPMHARLERRWGRMRAAALSTITVTLLLIVPSLALAGGLVNQALAALHFFQEGGDWATQLPEPVRHALDWLRARGMVGAQNDPVELARLAATQAANMLAQDAGQMLRNAAGIALKVFVLLFALFFLFRDGDAIVRRTRNLLPFDEARRSEVMDKTRELIFASVTASLLIGLVQGMLGVVAFSLVGLPSALFWGTLMAILALLPLIGAWMVWAPAALFLVARGHYGRAITVALICGGVAGILEHFVRPVLLGGKARMNSLLVLVSVLGGISVFGFLGFVLGPIIVALAMSILDAQTETPESGAAAAPAPGGPGNLA